MPSRSYSFQKLVQRTESFSIHKHHRRQSAEDVNVSPPLLSFHTKTIVFFVPIRRSTNCFWKCQSSVDRSRTCKPNSATASRKRRHSISKRTIGMLELVCRVRCHSLKRNNTRCKKDAETRSTRAEGTCNKSKKE